VLKLYFATFPSPSGLGYVLSRLQRSGIVAVDLETSRDNSRLALGFSWLAVSDL
jgi:hypothetical protein